MADRSWVWGAALCLVVAGCGDDEDGGTTAGGSSTSGAATATGSSSGESTSTSGGTGVGSSGDGTGAAVFSIRGTVTRSVDPSPQNDGIGTLYVAALVECDMGGDAVGAAIVPMADLSAADGSVDFTVPDQAPGTIFLASFLDDNEDADPMAPWPGPGDLAFTEMAGDGMLECVEVEVVDADVAGADIVLITRVPGL